MKKSTFFFSLLFISTLIFSQSTKQERANAISNSIENVLENYDRLCNAIGFAKEQVVLPDQVHEVVVRRATKADCGKGITRPRDYSCVDAQITNEPGAWKWYSSIWI